MDRAWNYMRRYGVVNDECYPYVSGQTSKVSKCKAGRRSNLLSMGCQLTRTFYGSGRDESATSFQKSLFKTLPAYRISPRQFDIMNEIYQRGPVQGNVNITVRHITNATNEPTRISKPISLDSGTNRLDRCNNFHFLNGFAATMKVRHDFFVYQSGIYRYSGLGDTKHAGYHSVRIVGWGEDGDIYRQTNSKYWVIPYRIKSRVFFKKRLFCLFVSFLMERVEMIHSSLTDCG